MARKEAISASAPSSHTIGASELMVTHEAGQQGVGDGEYGCGAFAPIRNRPTGPGRKEVSDGETEANGACCQRRGSLVDESGE